MKRRLFLTGPIGCGKSTAIRQALESAETPLGGFYTRRHREPFLHFTLQTPEGSLCRTFLEFSGEEPRMDLTIFSRTELLLPEGKPLVLDEIGGLELLCPEFSRELYRLLRSDAPMLGVVKGPGPASALIRRLGLSDAYAAALEELHRQLAGDPDTLVYPCEKFDPQALALARDWVKEYAHA